MLPMKFIDAGYGNVINANRIISVASFDSAPMKRLAQEAKENGMAIDVTCGHKCRSVIITDSKHVILSANEVTDFDFVPKDVQQES